jgi:3-isopropylmalate/(R)-2-methylmalate dehydratase large subunit
MAAGMATGKAWFKVPGALKIVLTGKLRGWAAGKDVILTLIGKIGVDGALYKSLEFCGEGVRNLSVSDRLCICNMAIEAGAKNGIFPVDDKTTAYLKDAGAASPQIFTADADALYDDTITINLDEIQPVVAFPHLPENVHTAGSIDKIKIDQAVIGSCTNGRFDDLEAAAKILKGKKVAKGIRCIIIPATQKVYLQALEAGFIKTFIESGAVVSAPTCGPCLGGHMGILAEGERAVATTNRNFVGRMGHPKSEVYLASPAVAAASAIAGYIASPDKI